MHVSAGAGLPGASAAGSIRDVSYITQMGRSVRVLNHDYPYVERGAVATSAQAHVESSGKEVSPYRDRSW